MVALLLAKTSFTAVYYGIDLIKSNDFYPGSQVAWPFRSQSFDDFIHVSGDIFREMHLDIWEILWHEEQHPEKETGRQGLWRGFYPSSQKYHGHARGDPLALMFGGFFF